MRVIMGSDGTSGATKAVKDYLNREGFEVSCHGALNPEEENQIWPRTAHEVALKVSKKEAQLGILFCWTGTGVTIVANKVKGIRAALCHDAETAAGSRKWNDANLLAISLRSCSEHIAVEMVKAFLNTDVEKSRENKECIAYLNNLDQNS